ncbi:MAG TPA: ABC transporter permease [Acetobacteraceae bacterium]|jgi:peptide/nickel transport system permease protein|nr:ABC transporter permease [Acetobacteraceae bacterium]
MPAFITSRVLQGIPVVLVVGVLSFAMFAYVGDPVSIMLGQDYTEAQRVALVHTLGLDRPFFIQYARYMWLALHGDFGFSYRLASPVMTLIEQRFPATFELSMTATILSLVIGLPMGVYTGIYRNSWLSRGFMVFSLAGISLPTFLTGILLILIFSVTLGWLPSFGRGAVVNFSHWSTGFLTLSGLKSLILPAITLALFQTTLIVRLVRAEMLEVLRSDYIKFARARGLPNRAINFGHALKNTLVPVITIIGLQIGGLLSFTIVTETVFQWPGMGLLLVQSIAVADIPVMSAYLMLVAVFFLVINLIVDLLYFVVDPRLRVERRAAGAAR